MTKRILSLMLAAILMLAVFATAAAAEEGGKAFYVYTENGKPLNVRDEPNGEIVGKLDYGTKVEGVSLISEYWAMITFRYEKNGVAGEWPAYVYRRYLISVDPAELEKMIAAEAETITGDPLTDINNEFASAKEVEQYKITVRPARITSWVNMRWIPSETGMIIAQYKATEQLIVLKELDHYLQVQDPDTGDVGYIHRKFAADEQ